MALVKVVPEKNGYKGRTVSVDKNGCFLLSKELSDELRNIRNLSVDFYKDDAVSNEWFMVFSATGLIPVRLKSDSITYHFHSAEMRRMIMGSVNVKDEVLRSRIKIIVGKMCVKDGIDVYPLITSSILRQVILITDKK